MIVRISMEDQYELPDGDAERLNQLDNEVVEAVEAGDEEAYVKRFAELIDFIRTHGRKLEGDDLKQSDVIIPPSDTDLAEARRDFTGEGVIPESVLPGSE